MTTPTQRHWSTADGTISVVPERGRVLQVTVGAHELLWTPSVDTSPWNMGGDRLWVGPERPWFFTDPTSFLGGHVVPPELDPGTWKITNEDVASLQVEQDVILHHLHDQSTLSVRLQRRFSARESSLSGPGIHSVSYSTEASLTVLGGDSRESVSLWRLLQVPPGGTVHVAASQRPSYRNYFEPVSEELVDLDDDVLRLRITAQRRCKIGVTAAVATGQIAYVRRTDSGVLLLRLCFNPDPSRSYVDTPLAAVGSAGDAVQIYDDDGRHGAFGEIEHHSPGIGIDTAGQSSTVTDVSVVTAAHISHAAWKKIAYDVLREVAQA